MNALARTHFAHDGRAMILCRCCGDTLHPEDFRPDYYPKTAMACENRYGGPVCTNCMDQHVICGHSGNAVTTDEAEFDDDGTPYAPGHLPGAEGFTGYRIGGA